MDYIRTKECGQLEITRSTEFLFIPSALYGFYNTGTDIKKTKSDRDVYCPIQAFWKFRRKNVHDKL